MLRRVAVWPISLTFAAWCAAAVPALAQTGPVQVTTPDVINTPGPVQVTFGGQTFANSGIVGMGRIPAGTRDFNNDSLGAFSGMDIDLRTWRRTASGYTGTMFGLADRGPNGIGSVNFSDYAGRLNIYNMSFSPYTGTANLPAAASSQNQLTLTQNGGFFFRDFNGNLTTGLDPGTGAGSVIVQHGLQLPGQTTGAAAGKISLDAESVRFLPDRTFYISDEYGANVYYFDPTGKLQGAIRPPAALLPRDASGSLSYSSLVDPVTGRRPNQGIEGMAITGNGRRLATLLQSATIQDSTSNQQDRTNTRLMIYDISQTRTPTAPIEDYVLQLPIYTAAGNGTAPNRTAAQSEILALNDKQFLVLSRDSLGLGLTTGNSVFKSILLVDTSGATNIAGTPFETSTTPISPDGRLNASLVPVKQAQFVNLLNATQLAKFGETLNNVTPSLLTLGEKWEGMALAPVLEEGAPQDFFLFVGNDNDFLSTACRVNNEDCAQAVNSDTHVMVFRLTLPTYVDPEYWRAMATAGPVSLGVTGQSAVDVSSSTMTDIMAHLDAARRAAADAGAGSDGTRADTAGQLMTMTGQSQRGTGPVAKGASFWASGVYTGDRRNAFPIAGESMTANRTVGTVGIEFGLTHRLSVGGAVGFGTTNPRTDDGFGVDTSGQIYGLFARYLDHSYFIHAAYSRGRLNANNISRPGAYGLTATARTDASSDAMQLAGGLIFRVGTMNLNPIAGFGATGADLAGYTETGAAGGNLQVPNYRYTSTVGTVGLEAQLRRQGLQPVLHAAYQHESTGNDRTVTVKLASATAAMASEPIVVLGTKQNFVSVGGGVQYSFGPGYWHWDYTAQLNYFGRTNHVVTGGIGIWF